MLSLMAHPCGQVVDIIHRPYRTLMRTSLDLPPVEVCWYRAPPGAKFIDVMTPFHSRDWDDPHYNPDGLGEVWPYDRDGVCPDFRPYSPNCVCVPYTGQSRVGSDEVWENGGVLGRDPIYVTDRDGSLPGCGVRGFCLHGGEREGGGRTTIIDYSIVGRGGEREGGHSQITESCEITYGCLVTAQGGEREGGHSPITESCEITYGCLITGQGGEREGGHVKIGEAVGPLTFGGEREGGSVETTWITTIDVYGGEREGGAAQTTWETPLVVSGGEREGGHVLVGEALGPLQFGGEREGGGVSIVAEVPVASGGTGADLSAAGPGIIHQTAVGSDFASSQDVPFYVGILCTPNSPLDVQSDVLVGQRLKAATPNTSCLYTMSDGPDSGNCNATYLGEDATGATGYAGVIFVNAKSGTGTARPMYVGTLDATALFLLSAGVVRLTVQPGGQVDVVGLLAAGSLATLRAVPATSSSAGVAGEIALGATHLYGCVATNSWKRIAWATF